LLQGMPHGFCHNPFADRMGNRLPLQWTHSCWITS
jgi:hypothetical protein